MTPRRVRTTVALSADLIESSRRAAIDAEFAGMASNRAYQEEAVQIEDEFAKAGGEVLRAAS